MEQLAIPDNLHQLYKVLQKFADEHQETNMQKILDLVQNLADQDRSAQNSESSENHQKKGRWAKFSEEIKKAPPLSGLGDYVRECSKEFREDFALTHDEA